MLWKYATCRRSVSRATELHAGGGARGTRYKCQGYPHLRGRP